MYILDTDTLIDFLLGVDKVVERVLQESMQDIAVTSITVYELQVLLSDPLGRSSVQLNSQQVDNFCQSIRILAFARSEAKIAGQLQAWSQSNAIDIKLADIMTAAITISYQGILVTKNPHLFTSINQLRLVSWY